MRPHQRFGRPNVPLDKGQNIRMHIGLPCQRFHDLIANRFGEWSPGEGFGDQAVKERVRAIIQALGRVDHLHDPGRVALSRHDECKRLSDLCVRFRREALMK